MKISKAIIASIFMSLIVGVFVPSPASAAENYTNPVSGFFIYSDTNFNKNLEKLDAIKAAGGDTVITFGNRLRPAGQNSAGQITTDGSVNKDFTGCVINGTPCVTAMKRSYNIRSVFTYGDKSMWDAGAVKCGNDRIVNNGGDKKTFTILVIPTQDNGCSSPNGQYDLVVINNSWPKQDATLALVNGTAERGMKYVVGLPAPVVDPANPHLPNLSYMATMEKFTDRFMLEYKSQYNTAGLAGFYHHFEQNLNSAWYETLSLYRMQNRMVGKHFGTSKFVMVSPYIDSRKTWTGATPAQAAQNALAIADTAEGVPMIIAPQDGVGTGKGAAYYDTEAWAGVDPWSIPESGAGTNAGIHHASTKYYYNAIRDALAPRGITLWANLEGMSASHNGSNTCTNGTARGATVKERLDKQVQMSGSYVAKNISFMWDHYYTCAPYGTSLAQEFAGRKSDPIVTGAWSEGNNLVVIGYNLNPARVDVRQGNFHITGNPIEHQTDIGNGLQKAVFPQTDMGLNASGNYLVTVTAVSGRASSLPSDLVASARINNAPASSSPSTTATSSAEASPEATEEAKTEDKKDAKVVPEKSTRGGKQGAGIGDKSNVVEEVTVEAGPQRAEPVSMWREFPKSLLYFGLVLIPLLAWVTKRMIRRNQD
ncbi:MAG: hypothetical protein H9W81_02490 [Enterococcus sp.]|nr:hypothetical protein [Enterococcus sp.]